MNGVISTIPLVCFVITFNAHAQEFTSGYYVTNQDTVRGQISVNARNTKVEFRKNLSAQTVLLSPETANTIQFGTQTLIKSEFDFNGERTVGFAQLVLEGPISFYRVYVHQNWNYLVEAPDEPIRLLKKDQLYISLVYMASGCDDLVYQLEQERGKLRYSIKDLSHWISQINSCKYPGRDQKTSLQTRKMVKKIGLELSGFNHSFNITGRFALGDYQDQSGFSGGILFELMLSEQIGLQSGLYYMSRVLEDDSVAFHPTLRGYYSRDVEITADYIALPLQFNYYITKSALKPFVSAGAQLGLSLGMETSEEFIIPQLPTGPGWEPYTKLTDDGWNYGFLFGAGLAYTMKKGEFVITGQYVSARLKFTGVCCISEQDTSNLKSKTARVALSYRYIF